MKSRGKLFLVSVGPGFVELIPPLAESALKTSEIIVGYDLYLSWITSWIEGKQIHALPITCEKDRAAMAIKLAREGRIVSLVSGGDIGIYGMAGLVLEMMSEEDVFRMEVIPGISAASSCASVLGSPLAHDYATLSLSDLLCPWEMIERRACHLAQADLVVVLYNVQSKARTAGVYRIFDIFLEYKAASTLCGVVRNAYRPGQEHYCCSLVELRQKKFDMLTTVIVGNKFTSQKKGFIYTARGYDGHRRKGGQIQQGRSKFAAEPVDARAVWVFSGTADGNALAEKIARSGFRVVISAASSYGGELAERRLRGASVKYGRIGANARRRELQESRAVAIVDATHPFATKISSQLIVLGKELNIPYLRYERDVVECSIPAIFCSTTGEAAAAAIRLGKRIFLATGSKDLEVFLDHPGAKERDWFVRVAPEAESLGKAVTLGIPRGRLLAIQGPCSRELNEVLWKNWRIDCVVTKESGTAGGFEAKIAAAGALGLALVVIDRPPMDYPVVASDFDSIVDQLRKLQVRQQPKYD
jgi:precorrin-6x reductase